MLERGLTRRVRHDRRRRAVLLLLVAASIWGCGGRAALEAEEDVTGSAGQTGAGPDVAAGGNEGQGSPMVPTTPPDGVVLPPCVPGFRASSANGRECTFIHERLCYEDEVTACACACPMGGSCIIGGFLDPEVPFPVSCRLQ